MPKVDDNKKIFIISFDQPFDSHDINSYYFNYYYLEVFFKYEYCEE